LNRITHQIGLSLKQKGGFISMILSDFLNSLLSKFK